MSTFVAKVRLLVATVVVIALLVPGASGAQLVPSRVQVVAREFSYTLSRRSVGSGSVIVEIVNFGQDPHDLRLQRVGGGKIYGTPIVQPGGHFDLELKLQRGVYQLWCSIANHRALGMHAALVVKS